MSTSTNQATPIVCGKLYYSTNGPKQESATHQLNNGQTVEVSTSSMGDRGLTVTGASGEKIGSESYINPDAFKTPAYSATCQLTVGNIRVEFTRSIEPHLENCDYSIFLLPTNNSLR